MDARVRTGASAYDQPPAAGYCPPGGAASSAAAGKPTGAGASAGAAAGTGATARSYSASMGDVGMSNQGSNGHGRSPGDAFRDMGARLGELKEFASYYVAAKADAWKVTFRNLGMYAALGIVGLIAGSAIISTAAVLLLVGLAIAIGKPFHPDQPWVGAIVVGLLVLGGLAGGIIYFMKSMTNTSRKRLVEKYQNRQRDQRIQFGEDVRGRRAGVTDEPARAER